jgi:hypothetical protein
MRVGIYAEFSARVRMSVSLIKSMNDRLDRMLLSDIQANLRALHGGSDVVTEDNIYNALINACRGCQYRFEVSQIQTNKWRIKCAVDGRFTMYDLQFMRPQTCTGRHSAMEQKGYYTVDSSGRYESVEAATQCIRTLLDDQWA